MFWKSSQKQTLAEHNWVAAGFDLPHYVFKHAFLFISAIRLTKTSWTRINMILAQALQPPPPHKFSINALFPRIIFIHK